MILFLQSCLRILHEACCFSANGDGNWSTGLILAAVLTLTKTNNVSYSTLSAGTKCFCKCLFGGSIWCASVWGVFSNTFVPHQDLNSGGANARFLGVIGNRETQWKKVLKPFHILFPHLTPTVAMSSCTQKRFKTEANSWWCLSSTYTVTKTCWWNFSTQFPWTDS